MLTPNRYVPGAPGTPGLREPRPAVLVGRAPAVRPARTSRQGRAKAEDDHPLLGLCGVARQGMPWSAFAGQPPLSASSVSVLSDASASGDSAGGSARGLCRPAVLPALFCNAWIW